MESLESRMARLTPEQRMEVEDFVDFLLLKNTFRQDSMTAPSPSPVLMNAPPVLSAEPAPTIPALHVSAPLIHEETSPADVGPEPDPSPVQEIVDVGEDGYMDYGRFEQAVAPACEPEKSVKRKVIARETREKTAHLLEWVD